MSFPAIHPLPSASAHPLAYLRTHAAAIAGALLLLAGAVVLMGIITAEAVYPDTYTTHENEVSDLGATRPPNSVIRQPSARIFNGTMLVSGAFIIAAAVLVREKFHSHRLTIPVLLLGVGVLGVGVFPGDKAPFHGIFAMIAFVCGGLAAVLSARALPNPLKQLSMLLGVVTLGSLVVAMLQDLTPLWDQLGDGGVERWVAYPVVLWLVAFGSHLMSIHEAGPAALVKPADE